MKTRDLFKFKPSRELAAVLLHYLLITAVFYVSFQVVTVQRVAAQFLTFGVLGVMALGILAPAAYSTLALKRPMSAIGITKDRLLLSIGLGAAFAVAQYFMTLNKLALPGFRALFPLALMAVSVGFFENVFFRGFAQTRLEESFGIVPGIVLSALLYCFYHVGYGMAGAEYLTLFVVGLVYSAVFRLTGSIFILFPLLTPMGAMYTNIREGLALPFEAGYGFALVIAFSVIGLVVIRRIRMKQTAGTARPAKVRVAGA
ncbi:MAG TPA: type II CAAX endopeptidase family protein [Candidatus Limnocylindria bacterium]|nr:type II CAAX endopeptidase family protein [Candidatus Limnocylindria bacterium]